MSFIRTTAPAPIHCVNTTLAATFELEPLPAAADHRLAVLVVPQLNWLLAEAAAGLRAQGVAVCLAADATAAGAELATTPGIGVLLADTGLLEGEGLGLAAKLLVAQDDAEAVELVLTHGPEEDVPEALADLLDTVQRALAKAAARRAGLPVPGRRGWVD